MGGASDARAHRSVDAAARERVHLIELPLGATRTVNAVLIDGDPLTLVDTGVRTPESLLALERAFAERGRRVEDLEQIVITHPHHDHFGAAAALVARSGARVVGDGAGVTAAFPSSFEPNAQSRLGYFEEAGAPDALRRQWRERRGQFASDADPVMMDRELVDGDRVRMGGLDWRVVSTPGHAATSISLFQPEARLLIAGDMLIGNAGASVTLHAMPRPGRWLLDILDSLARLGELDVELAYPGHGPLIEDARRVIPGRRARASQRLDDVAAMLRERSHSGWTLSNEIYPPQIGATGLGLSQAIGYLEALVAQERARTELSQGVREYRAS
jgi:glyoxylase-like metal-dependent hydrolase (beta-lactamase superfamily II)